MALARGQPATSSCCRVDVARPIQHGVGATASDRLLLRTGAEPLLQHLANLKGLINLSGLRFLIGILRYRTRCRRLLVRWLLARCRRLRVGLG